MTRQEPLVRAASRIRQLVEGGADAGYAGLEIAGDQVLLWWKGTPSAAVARAARDAGVPVEVRAAAHSRRELRAAADRLWRSAGVEHGGRVHALKVFSDGRGLEAAVRPGQARGLAALPDAGVPVALAERDQFTPTRRCDDRPAWSGGAAIRNEAVGSFGPCGGDANLGYNCTAGFGVRIGTAEYLLTAGHCGVRGSVFYDGSGQRRIGQATHKNQSHDLLLIETDATSRIWDGAPGVSDFTKPVVGWGWTASGQSLCYSGVYSGARCGFTVDGEYTTICGELHVGGTFECWNDMISAKGSSGGREFARRGDSGAPVFSLINDYSWAQAAGTVSGYIDGGDAEWIVFQDFGTATRDFPGLNTINLVEPM
ncbi:hypothetical protein FHS43_005783 [Streptosporangium becharense]|uniref:Peptidase S1 domain-containing protein n=1 Tax=Streptosporangium becharense TaxID=1816182 RepID=A0A7W9MJQ4_9ACTN|nr:hypothetical protein [Streptosporangium becharense]MBB2914471.1 hypothetical protein [Streptosporangium becharense]MBB5823497.1 hypothetical protein [Streptosporangium becharense]